MVKSSMSKIELKDAVADGPVVSEGGRRPSALSTGHGGTNGAWPATGALRPGQRWSVGRKREVVLRLLRGESAELLSRELGVPLYRLGGRRERGPSWVDGAVWGR